MAFEIDTFAITRPKPRLVAAAPFRDRVIQHTLCNVIQPFFERSFIQHIYACMKERGTHRAVARHTAISRLYDHVLKMDVWRFFRRWITRF